MPTQAVKPGDKLKAILNSNTPYTEEVTVIDQYLDKRGQKFPFEFAMKVLYEFLYEDNEPYPFVYSNREFIRDLRHLFLYPEVVQRFTQISQFTIKGIHSQLSNLENLFNALERKEVLADLDKIGLLEYYERYKKDKNWEGIEEVEKMYKHD